MGKEGRKEGSKTCHASFLVHNFTVNHVQKNILYRKNILLDFSIISLKILKKMSHKLLGKTFFKIKPFEKNMQ